MISTNQTRFMRKGHRGCNPTYVPSFSVCARLYGFLRLHPSCSISFLCWTAHNRRLNSANHFLARLKLPFQTPAYGLSSNLLHGQCLSPKSSLVKVSCSVQKKSPCAVGLLGDGTHLYPSHRLGFKEVCDSQAQSVGQLSDFDILTKSDSQAIQ